MPFPLRLIVLLCLALAPGLKAAETPTGDFSAKSAIIQRLQQTQIELQQHASDSDRLTYELLKRLESMIYHHQASLDFLAAKKNEYERATEAELSWAGFDQPGPYSILFSDELRMQLVSLQDQQRGAETRLLIITRAIRDSADQLSAYQRKERELSETAESEETTESRQRIIVLLQQNDISSQTEV